MFRSLLRYGELGLDGVRESISPPPNATSRQIRGNGALCILAAILVMSLMGLFYFSVSAILPGGVQQIPVVAVVPVFLFYALTIIGGYRLLVGKSPEPAYPGEVSLKRVAYGIGSTLLVFTLIFGLLAIGAYFFP
jgi:hypothetical protein